MKRPNQYYFNVPVELVKNASYRSNACCAECRHFFPTGRDTESAMRGFDSCSVVGQCRRSAPEAAAVDSFPKVTAHAFCGDFEMVTDEQLPFSMAKR